MYHEYKGLLSSHAKPLWSFHLSISCDDGKFIFLSSFSRQLLHFSSIMGRRLGWGGGEHLCGVIIPKSKLYYFFLLFNRVSRPSDVLIKKKKKNREVWKDWVWNHSVNPGQCSSYIPGFCIRVHACSMSSRVMQLCIESWCCLQAMWPWSS